MFTGIIESTGIVNEVIPNGSNLVFWLRSPLAPELRPDQSLSHDGVCLTVEEVNGDRYRVTAVKETLKKTILGDWQPGREINLERCLLPSTRIDGHIVQGHVDTRGRCSKRKEKDGSWELEFEFPGKFAANIVEKDSVCVNGISLTAYDVRKKSFRVSIIPYTFNHTNIKYIRPGDPVNLEFNITGKYIIRYLTPGMIRPAGRQKKK